jgi:hypothetical protein
MQRVQALIHRLELLPTQGGEHARRPEPLIRGAGAIVHAMHARAAALLAHELLDRLEEVDVQAREVVHASELGIGGLGGVAIIADERADDGAVLLLDMGTVVLLVRATAGEGDALALAPGIRG